MCRLTQPSSDPNVFQVLCHGDPWLNNCLFSYNENRKPTDIIFIDYQICLWLSPFYDLLYFFVTSTNHNLKENAFDSLIFCYHEELVKNLKRLKYTKRIPTLRDLHIDLMKNGFFATVLAPRLMAVMLMEPRNDSTIQNVMNDGADDLKKAMFSSPAYVKNIEALYTFLEKRGLLDIE